MPAGVGRSQSGSAPRPRALAWFTPREAGTPRRFRRPGPNSVLEAEQPLDLSLGVGGPHGAPRTRTRGPRPSLPSVLREGWGGSRQPGPLGWACRRAEARPVPEAGSCTCCSRVVREGEGVSRPCAISHLHNHPRPGSDGTGVGGCPQRHPRSLGQTQMTELSSFIHNTSIRGRSGSFCVDDLSVFEASSLRGGYPVTPFISEGEPGSEGS